MMNAVARGIARPGALVVVAVLGLSGCLGRSPQVRHYSMSPLPGPERLEAGGALGVGLGPVRFPRYLERPEIVTRLVGAELRYDEQRLWAGGFESNVVRVLARNLESRLGTERVVLDASAAPFPIALQVAVHVDAFEGRPGDRLRLRARWAVRDRERPERLRTGVSSFEEPVSRNIGDLVAAHDRVLAALADAIAGACAELRAP